MAGGYWDSVEFGRRGGKVVGFGFGVYVRWGVVEDEMLES